MIDRIGACLKSPTSISPSDYTFPFAGLSKSQPLAFYFSSVRFHLKVNFKKTIASESYLNGPTLFHVQCIDIWLRLWKNCPLCQASIVRETFGREVTALTVLELEVVGEIRVENSGGSGSVDSSQVGERESSQLRVEDNDDYGIVAIEDGADGEVSNKNLGNCEKINRVSRLISVHSYPSSTFEAPTQELNSYFLHSF
ncbi:hypothetical protein K1719_040619 [Acacia pycnantha]|nr:hypothetical protein K1719_040619 [Acacia pycnantha]